MTFIALLCVALLVWIVLTLHAILSLLNAVVADPAKEERMPSTMDYPVFSRRTIQAAFAELEQIELTSKTPAEEQLFKPGWANDIKAGVVNEEVERLMYEACKANVEWEHARHRMRFFIEANHQVRQGHWSIGKARYYFKGLEESQHDLDASIKAGKRASEWATQIQQGYSGELYERRLAEHKARMAHREKRRATWLKNWSATADY